MRCIVVAATQARLDRLFDALRDQQLDPASSTGYGAGASLAAADVSDVSCAVAVLPPEADVAGTAPPGLAAILVEIGVLIGSGIPTLVLVGPQTQLPPALAGLPWLSVNLDTDDDLDTLRLHLRVFARTAQVPSRSPSSKAAEPTQQPTFNLAEERRRLREVLRSPGPESSLAFEHFVVDLLSRVTDQIEGSVRAEDRGVDAVIGFGGRQGSPMVVLVEVKKLRQRGTALADAVSQLEHYLALHRADFGLIVVDQQPPAASQTDLFSMVDVLSADELLERLSQAPLERILREARNRAVHGA